ncbi:hypothetical protein FACS1894177_00350 [Bacteroidia bacterium]|nr:hypothetical protein FACS1894177_00350 [Bacteroidia bacterium]
MNQKKLIQRSILPGILFVLGACMHVFVSCEDNDKQKAVYDPNRPVELSSFKPDSGRISEMVLLDGSNFGSDQSQIKVYFNEKEATVLSSTGTRILALVPRLPGDICTLSVEVGGSQRKSYSNTFRYKIAASVTTLAGDGTSPNPPVLSTLEQSKFRPIYMGMDKDMNIFCSEERTGYLLRINVAENTVSVIATAAQGYNMRCPPYANPRTGVLQMGAEGINNRDLFVTLDPKEGWALKTRFISEWDDNGWGPIPSAGGNNTDQHYFTHYACLLNEDDGYFYTRYTSGHIVKIDPKTWKATIVGRTAPGITFGTAFHPINKNELWMSYIESAGNGYGNAICRIDVRDVEKTEDELYSRTFEKLSGPTANGHRDGPVEVSQFNTIRGLGFDSDGNCYLGDAGNNCIRMINTQTMMVETVVGIPGVSTPFKDGSKEDATFNMPCGIVIDADNVIYISDFNNNRIRRLAIE